MRPGILYYFLALVLHQMVFSIPHCKPPLNSGVLEDLPTNLPWIRLYRFFEYLLQILFLSVEYLINDWLLRDRQSIVENSLPLTDFAGHLSLAVPMLQRWQFLILH